MIFCVRHARKGNDGNLTKEGRQAAAKFGERLRRMGNTDAIVAPNARCEQTARNAGLTIVGRDSNLAIPEKYEEYLNGPVIQRMLSQPGEPWEQSYTRAVLEDYPYKDVFLTWGEQLASVICHLSGEQRSQARFDENTMDEFRDDPTMYRVPGHLALIGSSPRIELAYLALVGSDDWRDFPRCQELQGFYFDGTHATKFE